VETSGKYWVVSPNVRFDARTVNDWKREAALVTRYRLWIEHQDRKLHVFRVHRFQCDAYEEARHNLIEAKCSASREYVRMAVGQLLDYAFQVQDEIGECHKAILVPNKPDMSLVRWLETLGISAIWEDNSVFLETMRMGNSPRDERIRTAKSACRK
jgi:hypothetical protein